MSEYIRLKDAIVTVDTFNFMKMIGGKQEIIKEADAIKDLCDKFVLMGIDVIILNKDNTQYRFEGESEWHDITDAQIKIGVYGAIWTDKGLIYVAKINAEGELELCER